MNCVKTTHFFLRRVSWKGIQKIAFKLLKKTELSVFFRIKSSDHSFHFFLADNIFQSIRKKKGGCEELYL